MTRQKSPRAAATMPRQPSTPKRVTAAAVPARHRRRRAPPGHGGHGRLPRRGLQLGHTPKARRPQGRAGRRPGRRGAPRASVKAAAGRRAAQRAPAGPRNCPLPRRPARGGGARCAARRGSAACLCRRRHTPAQRASCAGRTPRVGRVGPRRPLTSARHAGGCCRTTSPRTCSFPRRRARRRWPRNPTGSARCVFLPEGPAAPPWLPPPPPAESP